DDLPDPQVVIRGNTVRAPQTTGAWAPNGIQVGYGATGAVRDNSVAGFHHPGPGWARAGIPAVGSDDVEIVNNTVRESDIGITVGGDLHHGSDLPARGVRVSGNTLHENQWGVVLENGAVDTVIQHNTLTDSTEDGIALNYMGQYGLPKPTGTRIENNTLTGNKAGGADYASDATVI